MVAIVLLSWNGIALLVLKDRNAWYPHQMAINRLLDGQRAKMSVGTGNTSCS